MNLLGAFSRFLMHVYKNTHYSGQKEQSLAPASVISELMIIVVMSSTWMHLYRCNLTMAHTGGYVLLHGCICRAAALLWPTQVIMRCYMDVFVQLQPYYGHTGLYSPDFGFCGTRATMSLCFNLFCNSNDCDIVSGTRKRGHGDRNKTKYCA